MRRIAKSYLTQQRNKEARLRAARRQERLHRAAMQAEPAGLQAIQPAGIATIEPEAFTLQDAQGLADMVVRLMANDPDVVMTGEVREAEPAPVSGAVVYEDPSASIMLPLLHARNSPFTDLAASFELSDAPRSIITFESPVEYIYNLPETGSGVQLEQVAKPGTVNPFEVASLATDEARDDAMLAIAKRLLAIQAKGIVICEKRDSDSVRQPRSISLEDPPEEFVDFHPQANMRRFLRLAESFKPSDAVRHFFTLESPIQLVYEGTEGGPAVLRHLDDLKA